jgi:hypothetical protein
MAQRYLANSTMTSATPNSKPQYISSEAYRAMLVRDGERRFQDWHQAFLAYQQAYLQDMKQRRQH